MEATVASSNSTKSAIGMEGSFKPLKLSWQKILWSRISEIGPIWSHWKMEIWFWLRKKKKGWKKVKEEMQSWGNNLKTINNEWSVLYIQ